MPSKSWLLFLYLSISDIYTFLNDCRNHSSTHWPLIHGTATVKALLMTRIDRRTVLQPRCWVEHPFYSGAKLLSSLSVWSSLLDHMVACSSVGSIHFPFWHQGHEKSSSTQFYSFIQKILSPPRWSQLSREPRHSAQSWAGSSSHMLPFHPKLAGNIITLSLVLLVYRFFDSVLFLHIRYYLLSIFQKLLKITFYGHKPAVCEHHWDFHISFIYFLWRGGDMVIWSHVLNRKSWVYIIPLWLKC